MLSGHALRELTLDAITTALSLSMAMHFYRKNVDINLEVTVACSVLTVHSSSMILR